MKGEEPGYPAERAWAFVAHLNGMLAGEIPEGTRFDWLAAGSLTPKAISGALDEMWGPSQKVPTLAGLTLSASGTLDREAAQLLGLVPPRCGAILFPLPRDPLTDLVLWAGEPVHPDIARRCGPVQGPQPVACLLDEGHRIGWHWNNGTWWKA